MKKLIINLKIKKMTKKNNTSNSVFNITIENKNNTVSKAIIFGSNKMLSEPNLGSDKGVSVYSECNVSYSELLKKLSNKSFETSLISIESENSNQISNEIKIESLNDDKSIKCDKIITKNYFYNDKDVLSVDVPYLINVNGDVSLIYSIEPKTKVNISFYSSSNTDIFNN